MRNYVTTYDPFFDLFFHTEKRNNLAYIFDTDIIEKKDNYEMKINLPHVKKEDVKVSLENGYLNVAVTTSLANEEKEENYILRERNYGSYSRNYFVGEDIKMQDISAKLNEGVLTLNIKKPNLEEIEKQKYIEIE